MLIYFERRDTENQQYVISFEEKGFFLVVPSPPLQVIPLIRPFLYNILTLPSTEMIYT